MIKITREGHTNFGKRSSMKIVIDGKEEGEIKVGEERSIAISEDECTLKFIANTFFSKEVIVKNGENVVVYFDKRIDRDRLIGLIATVVIGIIMIGFGVPEEPQWLNIFVIVVLLGVLAVLLKSLSSIIGDKKGRESISINIMS